jgi:hypothetical protein
MNFGSATLVQDKGHAQVCIPVIESWPLHHSAACGILKYGLLKGDTEEGIAMHVLGDIQAVHEPAPVFCPPAPS